MSGRKGMLALLSLVCVAFLCTGVISCAKKAAVPEQEVTQPSYEAPKPAPMPEAAEPTVKGPSALEEAQAAMQNAYFDFDKYNIRPDARDALKANYQVLSGLGGNVKILIEGHCDERGTVEYNLALGQRRADAAKAYYVSLGMSADAISTISYGEERPADPGHDEAAWAKNRRAVTVIQGM